MRILILGGNGMLGHQLYFHLSPLFEVKVTLRNDSNDFKNIFGTNYFANIDITDPASLERVFSDFKPELIINCIGVIKHRDANVATHLQVNTLFPHLLNAMCSQFNSYLIHFSTDCVFSGKRGNYLETDPSDAEDTYGKTKFLGEIVSETALTLRTSFIGFQLKDRKSLLEWLLNQQGQVKGFQKATFSGLTTFELARIIERILMSTTRSGLFHVGGDSITKFDLLQIINKKFKLNLTIVPDNAIQCNRALNSNLFNKTFHYTPPPWNEMIEELAANHLINQKGLTSCT